MKKGPLRSSREGMMSAEKTTVLSLSQPRTVSPPEWVVRRTGVPPPAGATNTSMPPLRLLLKAMRLPSGLKKGWVL